MANPDHARFCQGCGSLLSATTVQNRTVILAPAPPHITPVAIDAQTILQKVRQTFDGHPSVHRTRAIGGNSIVQREHTILVIDRSSSMNEAYDGSTTKLEAAIRAAVVLICNKAQIDAQDEIGIVAFNSQAELLMDLQPIVSHKRQMIQLLQSLTPENGTDIDKGLITADDTFRWNEPNVVRRIVLKTDGEGGDPLATAEALKSQGVVIDIIGIGDHPKNVNEKLLKKMASIVEGQLRYRFIKDQQTLVAHYTQLANKTTTSRGGF